MGGKSKNAPRNGYSGGVKRENVLRPLSPGGGVLCQKTIMLRIERGRVSEYRVKSWAREQKNGLSSSRRKGKGRRYCRGDLDKRKGKGRSHHKNGGEPELMDREKEKRAQDWLGENLSDKRGSEKQRIGGEDRGRCQRSKGTSFSDGRKGVGWGEGNEEKAVAMRDGGEK